ncbi:MAG: Smr/MutS family protein [Alphaproteobacteria bacterium]|nr:Smr/MutS family protein [Alphaproteobacteria bacterium]
MTGQGAAHRPRRRAVTPDEARIWHAVTRDVAPLPGREAVVIEESVAATAEPPPPAPPPSFRPTAAPPVKTKTVLAPLSPAQAPAGLDRRSAERMKKGEMEIEGRLDLHGMTQDSAHAHLSAFVTRAWESGKRCVLVITGKGGRTGPGVLRREVPRWLNQAPLRERIIGIAQARQKDGGDGALYVLIRRRR